MKKYVGLSVDAEAYYSGATYYEQRFITEEIYESIKDEIEKEICLGELDGKHSEVCGDLEVEYFTAEELSRPSNSFNDGDNLYYEILGTMEVCGYEDAKSILKSIEKEVNDLEIYEEVKVTIRKDKKEKLMKFVETLQ